MLFSYPGKFLVSSREFLDRRASCRCHLCYALYFLLCSTSCSALLYYAFHFLLCSTLLLLYSALLFSAPLCPAPLSFARFRCSALYFLCSSALSLCNCCCTLWRLRLACMLRFACLQPEARQRAEAASCRFSIFCSDLLFLLYSLFSALISCFCCIL